MRLLQKCVDWFLRRHYTTFYGGLDLPFLASLTQFTRSSDSHSPVYRPDGMFGTESCRVKDRCHYVAGPYRLIPMLLWSAFI